MDLSSDKPLDRSDDRDKLGFGEVAERLATVLLKNDLHQGIVVSVEGAWGSGKSSLVNMALEKLENTENGPHVIRFAPWLVGSRNELLEQLFADLEPIILDGTPMKDYRVTKNTIKRFVQIGTRISGFAATAGVPGAKIVNELTRKAEEYTIESLGYLNHKLREFLTIIHRDRPIVVFIDDLDRLDPYEVIEVFRLVKAVADFPNVAYILAYDPKIVTKIVKRTLRVNDGNSYLEKVVQVSFKVPKATNYDLRNWLRDDVLSLLGERPLDESVRDRLERVYRTWGRRYLETPRDVVRLVNAMKLFFVPVMDQVDPGDMVFLQIARLRDSKLYSWIENYTSNLSEFSTARNFSERISKNLENELLCIFNTKDNDNKFINQSIADLHLLRTDGTTLDLSKINAEKRLASPSYHRYYFSFDIHSGGIRDYEVEEFLLDCKRKPKNAMSTFRTMIVRQRPQGGRFADLLLDLVFDESRNIEVDQIEGLFQVLGKTIDDSFFLGPPEFRLPLNGNPTVIFLLIDGVSNCAMRTKILRQLFCQAISLTWLSGIIRKFSLENGGQGQKSNKGRILSEDEFQMCAEIFSRRLSDSDPADLLEIRYFRYLLDAWYHIGYCECARSWIREQTKCDEPFVDVMIAINRGRCSSNDAQYIELLEALFDSMNDILTRLCHIRDNEKIGKDVKSRAQALLDDLF